MSRDLNFVVIYALFLPNSNSQMFRVDKKWFIPSLGIISQVEAGTPLYQYDNQETEVQKPRKDGYAELRITRVSGGKCTHKVFNKPKQREQSVSAVVMAVRGQKQHQELEEGSGGERRLTSMSAPCGISGAGEQQVLQFDLYDLKVVKSFSL